MSKTKSNGGKSILAVIFCIPLAFIVYFWIAYSSHSITLGTVQKVIVSVPETTFTSDYADDVVLENSGDVDFYVDVLTSSLSINTPMRDVSKETPVRIICDREDKEIEYKLYPSLNLSGCLLVGPEDKLYVLETERAKALLLRDEFNYLYTTNFLPNLYVVNGNEKYEVFPKEAEWKYNKSDGKSYDYIPSKFATGDESYTILKGFENALMFSFDGKNEAYPLSDVNPQIKCISVNGAEFEIEDLSDISLDNDTYFMVELTAEWSAMNGAQSSGTAKYSFELLYDVPAKVELSKNKFSIGDVITVNATNINKDEVIKLDTLLDVDGINFSVNSENNGTAYLPVTSKNVPGEYVLEFTTGIETVTETIVITDRDNGEWTPISVEEEQYNSMLSNEKLAEFRGVLSDITANRPEKNYFVPSKDKFRSPVGDKTAKFIFGQSVTLGVTGAESGSGNQICEGVVYNLSKDTSVRSVQAGEVVFKDTLAPTGNTVIVYHGFGVYSYYYHLAKVSVEVGDVIKDGATIGVAGKTGFTNGETALHYAISIDGTFVDPLRFGK
ncbi:MAG: M23 family metallopeptidase [Clostridia bacterium]|nr:M23 family metallopeptidase [Clostridia bacterium]